MATGVGRGGRTIRVLNVAEKPSVAKEVSRILSRNQGLRMREGRSRFNKIYEFNCEIQGNYCQMFFTSVTGHLMELAFDDRYRKWYSCDPSELYHAPVHKHVPEDKLDIKRTLEEEARKCQWLVLWLDCDREGENIAFEVVDVCKEANRYLDVWRARFSALIDREIQESIRHLQRPNQLFSDAVDARQEIDLRIGASFTRFQTMLLRDAFMFDFVADNHNLILSYGPCQFPTLGFIVERYWEVESHEPEEFWTVNCTHNSEDGVATFNWMRGHLFDYVCALIVYEMCIQEPAATVMKVVQQEKLKYPPLPLNTIQLEKRASQYLRMSSEHTMKVAEDLYQAGFISYPRTETNCFSPATDLHGIAREQEQHPIWGAYVRRLVDPETRLWRNPGRGTNNDEAHPPIYPTKFSAGESGWSQDHHRVYELVVRHFLACVSQPAVGAETIVEIDIAGELFSASGRVIIEKNYLDIYRYESWGGSMLPTYTYGQQFIPTTLTLDSGVTKPPSLLSEADLLTCMDKAGIGTDATMHDHIKKLLDRFYAVKDADTRFSPTNLGEALVMGYDDMGYELWKPNLRAMMESDMKAVSIGTKRKADVLNTCLQQMKECFLDARMNKIKLMEAMEVFFERSQRSGAEEHQTPGDIICRCGVCQESDMALKRKPDGKFMVGCLGFPRCRNVVWLPGSISEATVTTNICNICSPRPMFRIHFKFRRLEIPPNYNVDHLGCIGGCDEILKQLTEICGTGARTPTNIPGRGRASTTSSASVQSSATSRRGSHVHSHQMSQASNEYPSMTSSLSTDRSQRQNPRNASSGEPSMDCTSCGAQCVLRTANTANNRGRKFYSCASRECNFFVWEDSIDAESAQRGSTSRSASNSRAGRRGRGGRNIPSANSLTFVSATGETVSGRSCFVCGDPSHFANACPSRGL